MVKAKASRNKTVKRNVKFLNTNQSNWKEEEVLVGLIDHSLTSIEKSTYPQVCQLRASM